MNPQQLQIARAALWHQNGSQLHTYDDAAPWLDEIGFCLFLPRHAQLPAAAPTFVEACLGEASMTPPAAAIATAMELATRFVDARRLVPLNLLGAFSEQPDFLATPEVLPWVAAIRGDRSWKSAPGGRTAPIVVRTWEALEKRGGRTAIELREELGREVTEAAVLRALIELWGTLRAVPTYTAGEPTRWNLMKDWYSSQLATAANTSQATALSAMLSIYLRQAVAATAEEAEIFLSPLTARSRIREVLHGMTASRSFGATTVGTDRMLFVEGSLPEFPEEAPAETAAAEPQRASAGEARRERRPPRPAAQRGSGSEQRRPRPDRGAGQERPRFGQRSGEKRAWQPRGERLPERPAPSGEGQERRTPREREARGEFSRPRQAKEFRPGAKREERPRGEFRGGREERRPGRFARTGEGGERRPQRSGEARQGLGRREPAGRPDQPGRPRQGGLGKEFRPGARREERPRGEFRGRSEGRPAFRGKGGGGLEGRPQSENRPRGEERPWRRERPEGEARPRRENRPPFSRENRERGGEGRPERKGGARPPRGEKRLGGKPAPGRGGRGSESRVSRPGKPLWKQRGESGGEGGGSERGARAAGRDSTRSFKGPGRADQRGGSGRAAGKFGRSGPGKSGFGKPGFGKSGFGKSGGKPSGKPRPGGFGRRPNTGKRPGQNPAGNPGRRRDQEERPE